MIVVLLQLGILLVFYSGFIFSLSSFYFADATFWLEPMARYISSSLSLARIPLWNPLCYCGMPQFAVTFPNLCYPPDYLFAVFPFNTALALSMVFHQSVAFIGMLLFIRSLGFSPITSIIGALTYAFSGYMFSLSSNHSLVAGAAWFPFVLWSTKLLNSTLEKKQLFIYCICGAVAIFLLVTSGRPEVFIPSIAVAVVFVLARLVMKLRAGEAVLTEGVMWQLRMLFLGCVLALPSILPTGEWLSISRRAAGLQTTEIFMYSANWYDLLSTIIGPALGDLRVDPQFRGLVIQERIPPYILCAFTGSVTLTLAIWGACVKDWQPKYFCIALVILSVVASMGLNTPVMPTLISAFPALGFVRFPIKLLFLAIFALSILAAKGASRCGEGKASWGVSMSAWLVLLGGSVACLASCASLHCILPFYAVPNQGNEILLSAQQLIGTWGAGASILGLLVSLLGWARSKSKITESLANTVLLSLTALTLCGYAVFFERSGAGAEYYQMPSFTADQIAAINKHNNLSGARVLGLNIELLTVPDFYMRGTARDKAVATFQYDRQILYPNTNVDFAIPSAIGFEGSMRGDFYHEFLHSYLRSSQTIDPTINPTSDIAIARFAQITGTGFVTTQAFRRSKDGKPLSIPRLDERIFFLVIEDPNMNVRIYWVKDFLPRCYFTDSWRWLDSHNAALDSILKPDENYFDPLKITLIERGPNESVPSSMPPFVGVAKTLVTLTERVPEQLSIKVNAKRPGFIVIADQVYPGWEAKLDNESVPIYVANGFNRAVFVPQGDHVIEFSFIPKSLFLGLALAGLALLLFGYLGWRSFSRESP